MNLIGSKIVHDEGEEKKEEEIQESSFIFLNSRSYLLVKYDISK